MAMLRHASDCELGPVTDFLHARKDFGQLLNLVADERSINRKTQALYYQGQPDFDVLVGRIHQHIDAM